MADNHASVASPISPTWTRPKTPLAPDRLAKLANALGVSTPIPPSERPSFLLRSYSESPATPDAFRRSPTPSMASAIVGFSQTPMGTPTSKFLLHVIPPIHLPHDAEDDDMTAPPPTASGYHAQFRRGTLVPVHSTLQAQLAAIAKEYALPSTTGMVLYLVSSGSSAGPQSPSSHPKSPSPWSMEDQNEPGPRLSEDIWRHLWIRVLQVEQRDGPSGFLLPSISRSPTPLMLSPTAGRSTPFLPSPSPLNASNLRPPTPGSVNGQIQSIVNSPSTPSSVSDTRFTNSKSAPPSRSGDDSINGDAEPGTPDTSVDVHSQNGHPNNEDGQSVDLPLPGLNSNSLIPILAKVEFDIDPQKAGWYQPWIRSRKVNKAKRAGARKASLAPTESSDGSEEKEKEEPESKDADGKTARGSKAKKEKTPTIPLVTGNKEKVDWDAMVPSAPVPKPEPIETPEAELKGEEGYAQLNDSESDSNSEFGDDDDFGEDSTAKVSSISHEHGGKKGDDEDPLEDVFGRDEDTWKDLKAERRATHEIKNPNPNVVNLTLTAEELANGDESLITDDSHFTTPEEEEVRELLDRMSQGGRTPDPHHGNESDDDEGLGVGEDATLTSVNPASLTSPRSAAQNVGGPSGKKHIPSPLILVPKMSSQAIISTEPSPLPSGTAGLAYLDGARSNSDSEGSMGEREEGEDDDDNDYGYRAKSPTESEKRAGALFEDLDLGLDSSEDYDDGDPNDRRRSQYVMRAQLDEIERTLAQLSPRIIKNDLEDDNMQSMNQSFSSLSPSMSFGSPSKLTMSPLTGNTSAELSPFTSPNRAQLGFDVTPGSQRLQQYDDPNGPPTEPSTPAAGASWPSVPFSQIKTASSEPEPLSNVNHNNPDPNQPPAPPQLAVNGVTTSAPRSFAPRQNVNGEASAESLARKKELEEEQALYGRKDASGTEGLSVDTKPLTPPKMGGSGSTDSPVIPLSPDPFGRFASSAPEPPIVAKAGDHLTSWDTATIGLSSISAENPPVGRGRSGTTSRFSVDSIPEDQIPAAPKSSRGTLMSVKSIKNLWRKSNKADKPKEKEVVPPTPTLPANPGLPSGPGRTSPSSFATLGGLLPNSKRASGRASPAGTPQRPERPSGENFDLPDVPSMPPPGTYGRASPQPPPGTGPSSRASDVSSRPSVDMSRGPSSQGHRPSMEYSKRPSMDAVIAAQQRRSESSQESVPPIPPHHNSMNASGHKLAVPYPASSRSTSPSGSSPIIPTQMLPSRGPAALDRLHFDQESPYPNPIRPIRAIPRTPSPTQHQHHPSQSGLSSITEGQVDHGQQQSQRSILKRNGSSHLERDSRSSMDRDRSSVNSVMSGMNGTNGLRLTSGRKASVASYSSGEVASSPTNGEAGGIGRRPSLAPSFVSQASSIDSSQFEFVSPKMTSGMAYPASGYYGSGQPDS